MSDEKTAPTPSRRPKVGHGLLHTPAEERFDRITRLAQQALDVPIAAVVLLDDGKQWFKSAVGWNAAELPEESALCSWAFEADGPTVINDMKEGSRTADHPFVTGSPNLRFFAAYPLLDHNGWPIGGFCVADVKPRALTTAEQQSLLDLAELAQREVTADGASPDASLATTLSSARREGMIDPLTRIWNRRGAYVLLRTAFERADQRDEPLGIGVVDVDDFKCVNEHYGHQIGDEVLRKLAARLVNAVRSQDLVFRLVDNRFLFLLANVQKTTAERSLARVRWALSATSVPTRGGNVPISVRAVLIHRAAHDDATVEKFCSRANKLLKKAKKADSSAALVLGTEGAG